MESAHLLIVAILVGANAAAAALAYRTFPLWFLGIGQQHGRYAGLGSSDSKPGGDSGKTIPALPWLASAAPTAGLFAA